MSRYTYQLDDLSHLPTIKEVLKIVKKKKNGRFKNNLMANGPTKHNK
jgi:hypothetical protein